MSELNVSFTPTLRRPVLIAAFRGWNDGGQGASLGAAYLAKQWGAERFAEIEPESFFDFQAVRPHVSLVDGETRRVEWPDNGFFHAEIPGADRDAILLLGIEPNLRWRTFSGLVLELAKDLGVEMVVTFGSLLADVPHTRPAPVTAAATDPALVAELGLEASRSDGPTGIVGIVHDRGREAGIPSVLVRGAGGVLGRVFLVAGAVFCGKGGGGMGGSFMPGRGRGAVIGPFRARAGLGFRAAARSRDRRTG